MFAYIVRRLLLLIPVLIGMTIITFAIVHLIPGNPAQVILGEAATPSAVEDLEERLGLNEPYLVQYGVYVTDLLQGDLGTSLKTRSEISGEIYPRLRSEEHTSELQSRGHLVCRLLLEKKNKKQKNTH